MPVNDSEKNKTSGKKTTTKKTTVRKKTTAKKAGSKKAVAKKKKTAKKSPVKKSIRTKVASAKRMISAEERHMMIETCAYFQAEARGFEPGSDWDHWLQAEKEIDALLGQSK